jgi:predicted permease
MKRAGILLARLFAQPRSWFCAAARRNRLEAEMEAELSHHLEQLTGDLVRAGHSPAEAARRARIALGSPVVHKDGMRASLGLRLWDDLGTDIRYGARRLRRDPGFTAIAVLSLAMAIGANTGIFSITNQLLYARLNVPHPDQLRLLRWDQDDKSVVHDMWGDFDPDGHGGIAGSIFSYPVFRSLQQRNRSFDGLTAFKQDGMNATIGGMARQVQVEMVAGNYYSVLQVRPQLGRAIEESDDAIPGSGAVAVISDTLWQREFGRSPTVLGRAIRLNQAVVTIVGVNPREFSGTRNVQDADDVFVPISMQPLIDPKGKKSLLEDQDTWWLNVIGRMKAGVANASAEAELNAQLAAAVRGTMTVKAGETIPRLLISDGSRGLRFANAVLTKPLYMLLSMTGLVLLLACVNIANLLLARGMQRQRETSVRLAMGAGRARILRQMLVESLMLAGLGGLAGLAFAFLGRNILPSFLNNPWSGRRLDIPFAWNVFAFAAAITLATGLLFGLGPAWMATRTSLNDGLKASAQTATRRRTGWGGKGIVAFQVALSTLLVIGAGLFLRTILALEAVEPGFQVDHLVLFEVNPPELRYGPGKDVALQLRLERALAEVPGVQGVTPGLSAYVSDSMSGARVTIETKPNGTQAEGDSFNIVGSDFWRAMGIPMLAGRSFNAQDTATSPKVAVINEAMAHERFPGVDPIGKRFHTDVEQGWIEIVGVCGNNRYRNLRDEPPPQFFLPLAQQTEVGGMTFAVRTAVPLADIVPALRRAVQQQDPDLPIIAIRTQREQIEATTSIERMIASLMAVFGALALMLACIGIYGVMAYSVANRTNEIGIRLTLGALPHQILRMVLSEASWISLAGIAAGLCAALALARLVKSMLYGLQPADPVTSICGAGLLLAVGLLASWIPAKRAAAIEPMEALRHE